MEYTFDDAVLEAIIAHLPGRASQEDRETLLVAMTNISHVPGWDVADEPELTQANYLAALLNELEMQAEYNEISRVLAAFRRAYPAVEPRDFGDFG